MAVAAVSEGRSHLRDASFSSYLDTADTDFVRSFAASMHESSPIFTSSRQSSSSSPSPSLKSKQRSRAPLGESSVFGAESYFSDKVDRHHHHDRTPSFRSAEGQLSRRKHKSNPRTPSIRSESNCSSKSSRNADQMKPNKSFVSGPWFFSGLQCKGSCYDVVKPHVYTNHVMIKQTHQRKSLWKDPAQINSKKQLRHQIKSGQTTTTATTTMFAKQPERTMILPSFAFLNTQQEIPRKSIEVFGLHSNTQKQDQEDAGDMSWMMEKKLSMLSWDAIPIQSQDNRRGSVSCRYDDVYSDASSDLFDLPVFPVEMSPVTAPYDQPSEASTEWGVVTASAAALSDLDEERQIHAKNKTPSLKPKSKEFQKITSASASASARMASFPPKKAQISGSALDDYQVFSPTNTSFASKTATANITPFSSSPPSSTRAPRPIYMY